MLDEYDSNKNNGDEMKGTDTDDGIIAEIIIRKSEDKTFPNCATSIIHTDKQCYKDLKVSEIGLKKLNEDISKAIEKLQNDLNIIHGDKNE